MIIEDSSNNNSNSQNKKDMCKTEENIPIQKFSCSDDLKNEIRQKIASHNDHRCESLDISSKGEFISISFRHKD